MENLNQKTIKPIIAEIVDIENNDQWDIYDYDPSEGLYLIHYNMNTNLDKMGHIRGVVVDIYGKKIVCASYGHTMSIISDKLENKEKIETVDANGNPYELQVDNYVFKRSIEGVIIRVFVFNGKIYYSTNRRLNILETKSRWGPRTHFRDMLKKFGIPGMIDLYGKEIKYSPWTVIIMITHKDVLHGTKEDIGEGYLSLLDTIKMWDSLEGVEDDEINFDKPVITNITNDVEVAKTEGKFFVPTELSFDEINKHLYNGFSDLDIQDARLRPGESIVGLIKDENKWPLYSIRIQSTGYTWRLSLRGDGLNPYLQFFTLLNLAKIDTSNQNDMQTYKTKFPLLNIYTINSVLKYIQDNGYIKEWNQDKTSNSSLMLKEDRIYNIWACYLMSVPLHLQDTVSKMYLQYLNDIKNLSNYIYTIYISNTHSGNENIDTLIIKSMTNIKKNIHKVNDIDKNKLIQNSIYNELSKKSGRLLYRMIKYNKTNSDNTK